MLSLLVDRPVKRPRLSSKRSRFSSSQMNLAPSSLRTLSHKGRSDQELMQQCNIQDPREVARKCKICTKKRSARPCLTILRQNQHTGKYKLSERFWSCVIERQKCEWPAGAVIKNAERRERVESRHPLSLTTSRELQSCYGLYWLNRAPPNLLVR